MERGGAGGSASNTGQSTERQQDVQLSPGPQLAPRGQPHSQPSPGPVRGAGPSHAAAYSPEAHGHHDFGQGGVPPAAGQMMFGDHQLQPPASPMGGHHFGAGVPPGGSPHVHPPGLNADGYSGSQGTPPAPGGRFLVSDATGAQLLPGSGQSFPSEGGWQQPGRQQPSLGFRGPPVPPPPDGPRPLAPYLQPPHLLSLYQYNAYGHTGTFPPLPPNPSPATPLSAAPFQPHLPSSSPFHYVGGAPSAGSYLMHPSQPPPPPPLPPGPNPAVGMMHQQLGYGSGGGVYHAGVPPEQHGLKFK
jgi:hypothetical protein